MIIWKSCQLWLSHFYLRLASSWIFCLFFFPICFTYYYNKIISFKNEILFIWFLLNCDEDLSTVDTVAEQTFIIKKIIVLLSRSNPPTHPPTFQKENKQFVHIDLFFPFRCENHLSPFYLLNIKKRQKQQQQQQQQISSHVF